AVERLGGVVPQDDARGEIAGNDCIAGTGDDRRREHVGRACPGADLRYVALVRTHWLAPKANIAASSLARFCILGANTLRDEPRRANCKADSTVIATDPPVAYAAPGDTAAAL